MTWGCFDELDEPAPTMTAQAFRVRHGWLEWLRAERTFWRRKIPELREAYFIWQEKPCRRCIQEHRGRYFEGLHQELAR